MQKHGQYSAEVLIASFMFTFLQFQVQVKCANVATHSFKSPQLVTNGEGNDFSRLYCITFVNRHSTVLDKNDVDTGPAYIVKHPKAYLTVEDIQRVYQGRWLNDQVRKCTLL